MGGTRPERFCSNTQRLLGTCCTIGVGSGSFMDSIEDVVYLYVQVTCNVEWRHCVATSSTPQSSTNWESK